MSRDETAFCLQWTKSDGEYGVEELVLDRLLPSISVGHQVEFDEIRDDHGTRMVFVIDEVAWRVTADDGVLLWIGAHEVRD